MRALICLALLLPAPALADVIEAQSHVTAVTVFAQGAEVTREVAFTAPPGKHQIVIPGLPYFEDGSLRVSGADGTVGAISVRMTEDPKAATDAYIATEARLTAAREALWQAEAVAYAIKAGIEAQEARIAYLTAIRTDRTDTDVQALTQVSDMIATQVLAARTAALAGKADLAKAQLALDEAQARLDFAQNDLDRMVPGKVAVVELDSQGAGRFLMTYETLYAQWAPVYDMALDRTSGTIALRRGVLVSQSSGENWQGVDLTLSTAEPGAQSEPGPLWPDVRRIGDPVPEGEDEGDMGGMAAPVMPPEAGSGGELAAKLLYRGDTVVYTYSEPVDVGHGALNLRLALDNLDFPARVFARAVPKRDDTAYLMAELTNGSGQILLPGRVTLYRGGVAVGDTTMPSLPPGASHDFGFGALQGIRLTRSLPERAEGDRGVISTTTQIEEKARITVQNLTEEAWPVTLLDQVPYSEQEDLQITFTADPEPTARDVDGERGILQWDFDLAPGETRVIQLDSLMSWPQGKVLR